jgi:hypothetical protein
MRIPTHPGTPTLTLLAGPLWLALGALSPPVLAAPTPERQLRSGGALAITGASVGAVGLGLVVGSPQDPALQSLGWSVLNAGDVALLSGASLRHTGLRRQGRVEGLGGGVVVGIGLELTAVAFSFAAEQSPQEMRQGNLVYYGGPDPGLLRISHGALIGAFLCGGGQLLFDRKMTGETEAAPSDVDESPPIPDDPLKLRPRLELSPRPGGGWLSVTVDL